METPVVLLVFNRPELTRRVLNAIAVAAPRRLLVVADGPRVEVPEDRANCSAVRALIEEVHWDCEVLKNYSGDNLGCRKRIQSGLAWAFEIEPELIIIEDDCLAHPSFFSFCEQLLAIYRDDERVMMITGLNYLLDRAPVKESYLFSRYFAVWGWASWRRAWSKYDPLMAYWPKYKEQKQLEAFYQQNYVREHLAGLFDEVYSGSIDTWDMQWFYSCLFNNGLCAVPRVNLVSNIGYFGSHSRGKSLHHDMPTFGLDADALVHPRHVFANQLYDATFFRSEFGSRDGHSFKESLRRLVRRKGWA